MFYWWKVQKKKKQCTGVYDIEFISLQFKLCCLIPFSKYQSISVVALEVKCAWYLHPLPIHLLINLILRFSDNLLQSPVNSNFRLIGSWLHSQRSSIHNGPVYSGHPVYYSRRSTSPKFSIGLYSLQCWPVYSGHPASNNHLAISQEWPLYTGLTVCTFALNIALWYQNWNQKPFRPISHRLKCFHQSGYSCFVYVFIVVQGHITAEWSSATLQLLDWKHKGTGCTKSNSHWTANFDGRGYEVSNDSCCLVIVSCSWLVMVMSLVSPRSWVHWSGVKPQSQFR